MLIHGPTKNNYFSLLPKIHTLEQLFIIQKENTCLCYDYRTSVHVMVSVLFTFFLHAVEPLLVLHLGFYEGRIGFVSLAGGSACF